MRGTSPIFTIPPRLAGGTSTSSDKAQHRSRVDEWVTECATHIFPSKNSNSRPLKKKKKKKKKRKRGLKWVLPPETGQKIEFFLTEKLNETVTKLRPEKNQILSTRQKKKKKGKEKKEKRRSKRQRKRKRKRKKKKEKKRKKKRKRGLKGVRGGDPETGRKNVFFTRKV